MLEVSDTEVAVTAQETPNDFCVVAVVDVKTLSVSESVAWYMRPLAYSAAAFLFGKHSVVVFQRYSVSVLHFIAYDLFRVFSRVGAHGCGRFSRREGVALSAHVFLAVKTLG
jgi:hypothetical protein